MSTATRTYGLVRHAGWCDDCERAIQIEIPQVRLGADHSDQFASCRECGSVRLVKRNASADQVTAAEKGGA